MSKDPRGGMQNFKGKDTRWKKGESGNPSGRPRCGFSYRKELETKLSEVDPADELGRTNGQIIVAKQVELAKMGSIRAVNEILDRLLGKPPQAVNVGGGLTVSREEHISNILASLESLKPLAESADDTRSGNERVN